MNNSKSFFYARVSSSSQSVNRQIDCIKEYNLDIDERDIFIDSKSGKDFNRENFLLLKKVCRKSDVIYVKSLDRFGRNYQEIMEQWRDITSLGVDIVVLDMPLLDTRQNKDLLGNFVSNLILEILSYVSEQERLFIRERQLSGIISAKKRNVKFGAPKIQIDYHSPHFQHLYKSWKAGEIKTKYFINSLNLKPNTFYRRIKEYEKTLR
ncbi:recombinase family protein [Clostridium nigeriense]|uniref:recombinase family protein n=1 Tax=Clostridium nigeriense TaxID=1805470 RepID=UPI0008359EB1|nr:recombinase family protein [Clostridium nigeriense]